MPAWERLLYLRAAIAMHKAAITNSSNTYAARILSDKHWAVIEYVVPLLEPFMLVQRALEAEKYVTPSTWSSRTFRRYALVFATGWRSCKLKSRQEPPPTRPRHERSFSPVPSLFR